MSQLQPGGICPGLPNSRDPGRTLQIVALSPTLSNHLCPLWGNLLWDGPRVSTSLGQQWAGTPLPGVWAPVTQCLRHDVRTGLYFRVGSGPGMSLRAVSLTRLLSVTPGALCSWGSLGVGTAQVPWSAPPGAGSWVFIPAPLSHHWRIFWGLSSTCTQAKYGGRQKRDLGQNLEGLHSADGGN